jgi:hypothetical protein
MSYLRQIMQRLQQRRSGGSPPPPASAGSEGSDGPEGLRRHLEQYRQRLEQCSDPMLQYEWAWLEEHLAVLELAAGNPEMQATAGGEQRIRGLLEESRRFQELLEAAFRQRGLSPASHRGSVVASEHAWELSQPAIRRQWGFGETAPSG